MYSNAFWMMAEKLVSIIGLVFVNSYMAKYIGPTDFGKITFATTIFTFVQAMAWFGGQNILFKRMSEKRKSGIALALHTQKQRRVIFALSSLIALFYLFFFTDTLTFVFGVANCIATYYIVMDVFAVYNNTQLISRINALTNGAGLCIAYIFRFLISYLELPVYTFSIPIILIPAIPYVIRFIYFYNTVEDTSVLKSKTKKYNKYLISAGGSLLLSTLSIVVYTQVSNIFLAKVTSYSNLGIYNVALTLGSAYSFISVALITSFFSKIYQEKDFEKMSRLLTSINRIVIVITIFILFGFYFLGPYIISMLYGSAYKMAVELVPIIILATMFSSLGAICYRFIIKYSGYKYLSYKMMLTGLLSIPFSYVMINRYDVFGAAYCFLVVEVLSCTLLNYFFRSGMILRIHLNVIGLMRR